MLVHLFEYQWPRVLHAKFLLLPGGFVSAPWPDSWSGAFGWDSSKSDFEVLSRNALSAVKGVLSARVLKIGFDRVDNIVIGVDVGPDFASGVHAELIVVYDVKKGSFHVTGKSLPRSDQRKLVRVVDLGTHFLRTTNERVLILGCHDLNLFSPRGRNKQTPNGMRHSLRKKVDARVTAFRPTVAIQLPHGTDTPRTWRASWNALRRLAPSISAWASAISYYRIGSDHSGPRASLHEVLDGTRGESCIDFRART